MKIVLDVSEFQTTAQLDHLLHNAPDEIVGVYIKATQDVTYRDDLAAAFAKVCQQHNTAFGYYDFLTNADCAAQAQFFETFVSSLPRASLMPMLDCEGAYDKWSAGVEHWKAVSGKNVTVYAQLSNMPQYGALPPTIPLWVAQYDRMAYYQPSQDEINAYTRDGYVLWQFTSNYLGLNQDASVVLADMNQLGAAA